MQNAALYIRVSTDDQLEFSPDAQRHALMDYAKKNDMHVAPEHIFIDEGITGTNVKKRLAFQQMIATCRSKAHPIDVILVHKFDRFARSREDSVVYKSLLRKECGIKVISITEQLEDDKFSVILEAMLEAMAEYYSLNLSDEVKKGMTEKAKRGGFQASSPYGYNAKDKKGKLEIIADEAKVVKIIFDKFIHENMTYVEITNYINDLGYRTRKGNRFEKRTIRYMLENPVYAGYNRWNYRNKKTKVNPMENWIIAKGVHEAIISEEDFKMVQNKNNQIGLIYSSRSKPPSTYKHWLSGMLRCSTCKGTLTFSSGYVSKKNPNAINGYYSCNRHKKGSCPTSNSVSLRNIQDYILTQFDADLEKFKAMDIIPITVKKNENEVELEAIKRNLAKIEKKLDMVKEAYIAEIDTLEEYKINKGKIKQEEILLKNKLKTLQKEVPDKNLSSQFVKIMSKSIAILKDPNIDILTKNKAIRNFVATIIVDVAQDTLEIEYYIIP